jgi:hypothetical protein
MVVSRSRRWLLPLVSASRSSVSSSRFVSRSPSFHLHLSSPAPPSRRGPLSFALPPPERGAAERRGESLAFPSRVRDATPCLPCDGRAPHGAPRDDFRPRDRRFIFRQCPPESAPRLRPRPGITSRPLGPAPPAAAVRSAASGRHSPLRPQGATGGAPHERGDAECSNNAIRGQVT